MPVPPGGVAEKGSAAARDHPAVEELTVHREQGVPPLHLQGEEGGACNHHQKGDRVLTQSTVHHRLLF